MSVVIDTPDGMRHFVMAQRIAMLSIQSKTGMVYSKGSVLKLVRKEYGVKASTIDGALAELKALYLETYGREYGS